MFTAKKSSLVALLAFSVVLSLATAAHTATTTVALYRMGEDDGAGALDGSNATLLKHHTSASYLLDLGKVGGSPATYSTGATAAPGSTKYVQFTTVGNLNSGDAGFSNTNITNLGNRYGFEAWVKPNGYPLAGGDYQLFHNQQGSLGDLFYGHTTNTGSGLKNYAHAAFYETGYGQHGVGDPDAVFDTDADGWHHLAVVQDAGTQTIYVDFVAASTTTGGGSAGTLPTGNFTVGRHNGGGAGWAGGLDDVRVFTFAEGQFSVSDLGQSYAAAEGVPEPSTFVLAALGLMGLGFVAWRRRVRR